MYVTKPIPPNAVVYSFGVGTDISWDLAMIEQGATVHAFDPSPTSIKWLKTQSLPDRFIFHPYGLANFTGFMKLYPPPNPKNVSYSSVRKLDAPLSLPVKTLADHLAYLRHEKIDVLKIDIEGAEYGIIPAIIKLDIDQLLIEFHGRFTPLGFFKNYYAMWRLWMAGYNEFAHSGEDYSFSRI